MFCFLVSDAYSRLGYVKLKLDLPCRAMRKLEIKPPPHFKKCKKGGGVSARQVKHGMTPNSERKYGFSKELSTSFLKLSVGNFFCVRKFEADNPFIKFEYGIIVLAVYKCL